MVSKKIISFFVVLLTAIWVYEAGAQEKEFARRVIKKYLPELDDSDPLIVQDAASMLSEVAGYIKELPEEEVDRVVDGFAKALEKEDKTVRKNAIEGLFKIGPRAKIAVKALCNILESKKHNLQHEEIGKIALLLGNMGPDAKEAVPILLKLLQDKVEIHPELCCYKHISIVRALSEIGGGEEIIDALCKTIRIHVYGLSAASGAALGRFGEKAIPILKKLLIDDDYRVRCSSIIGLEVMEEKYHAITLPLIVQALSDNEVSVRRLAVTAIVRTKSKEPIVRSFIEKALKDSNEYVRLDACAAYLKLKLGKKEDLTDVLDELIRGGYGSDISEKAAELLNPQNKK